jgi:hypothetical protein
MSFMRGEDTDAAFAGAELIAEFLRTVRDADKHFFPKREWW